MANYIHFIEFELNDAHARFFNQLMRTLKDRQLTTLYIHLQEVNEINM